MLFMVIEKFKDGDPARAGELFRQKGRMLPDGVIYQVSWMEKSGKRCFQVMEAANRALLDEWVTHWDGLVDFEVTPILTSMEFWSAVQA